MDILHIVPHLPTRDKDSRVLYILKTQISYIAHETCKPVFPFFSTLSLEPSLKNKNKKQYVFKSFLV